MSENKFSDLSDSEWSAAYLADPTHPDGPTSNNQYTCTGPQPPEKDLPDALDWAAKCMHMVLQVSSGYCGQRSRAMHRGESCICSSWSNRVGKIYLIGETGGPLRPAAYRLYDWAGQQRVHIRKCLNFVWLPLSGRSGFRKEISLQGLCLQLHLLFEHEGNINFGLCPCGPSKINQHEGSGAQAAGGGFHKCFQDEKLWEGSFRNE